MASLAGLSIGAVGATLAMRFASSHAVKDSGTKDANGKPIFTDSPAAGETYNVIANDVPIWGSWKRLAAAGVSVIAPFAIASYVRGSAAKSFFQLAGFGALGAVGAKAVLDGATKFFSHTAIANRLLAPEITGQVAQIQSSPTTAPAAVPIPTLAGLPNGSRTFRSLAAAGDAGNWLNAPPAGYIPVMPMADGSCPANTVYVRDPNNLDAPLCYVPNNLPPPPNQAPPPTTTPPAMTPPVPGMPPAPCPPCPPGAPPGSTPYNMSAASAGACCTSCGSGGPCACERQSLDWSSVLNSD